MSFSSGKRTKTECPPVTFSAVRPRLSVSSLCQRKDNTRRLSWFGGGCIRGCWCIDSYPLLVYESCINGWDSHYLHACLLSPTSAGKKNKPTSVHRLFPSDTQKPLTFLSPPHAYFFFLSHTGTPLPHSISYGGEIKGKHLVFMCLFLSLFPSPPTSAPFFALQSSSATC